jgi:hypothetical protein
VDKASKANISDTQTAAFDHGSAGRLESPHLGRRRRSEISVERDVLRRKARWKASVFSYDFVPVGKGEAVHKDVTLELEQFPRIKPRRIEQHCAPAVRGHMKDLSPTSPRVPNPSPTSSRATSPRPGASSRQSLDETRRALGGCEAGNVIGDESESAEPSLSSAVVHPQCEHGRTRSERRRASSYQPGATPGQRPELHGRRGIALKARFIESRLWRICSQSCFLGRCPGLGLTGRRIGAKEKPWEVRDFAPLCSK